MTSREVAASAVAAAWNDAGICPPFHANAKRELFRNWPTLAHAVARLSQTAPDLSARELANRCLEIIEQACATAEDQEGGNDREGAVRTLADMAKDLITVLAPCAYGAPRESDRLITMPKTVIILRNGNSLQVATTTNTAEDIAGLMNAGTPSVYVAQDVVDGMVHHVRVSEILDVYQMP